MHTMRVRHLFVSAAAIRFFFGFVSLNGCIQGLDTGRTKKLFGRRPANVIRIQFCDGGLNPHFVDAGEDAT
ncbi:hypothetical protein GLUCORHAEAF1_12235 [Komagataeibacter rhaeticus AF1]|nr:hypothetical protein GLUCORHAEAF1_12235 [Komagataeibacter rhaeticus AF1]